MHCVAAPSRPFAASARPADGTKPRRGRCARRAPLQSGHAACPPPSWMNHKSASGGGGAGRG
eukprot:2506075-Prymnesium_polylepis.3